jgi:hypothetical protein
MESNHDTALPDERRSMIEQLVRHFRSNGIQIQAAVELDGFPLPSLFPNPGYGDQRRKQPHVLGIHEGSGELYIGLVKTRSDNIESESSLTEYDLYFDISARNPNIRICIMIHEDRVHEFNSFITHYIHPDLWDRLLIVAFSPDRAD